MFAGMLGTGALGILGALALFGGVPENVNKEVVIFNDTKAALSVDVEGLGATEIAPGASSARAVPAYGLRVFATRIGSHSYVSRYNLGPGEGLFQPPDHMRWCITVNPTGVQLMARQDCYTRLKRR